MAIRPARQSRAVDKVFDWRVVSPRVGINFKVTDSGSTLLKAHYGRYYRGIVTGEFDNTTPSITPRYVFSGLYSPAGVPLDKELVSDNSKLTVDPNLKNPYTDQFIAGLGAAGRAERRALGELRLQDAASSKRRSPTSAALISWSPTPLRPAPTCPRCIG